MFLFSSVVAVPLSVRNPRKARPVEVSPPAVDVEVGVRFLLPSSEFELQLELEFRVMQSQTGNMVHRLIVCRPLSRRGSIQSCYISSRKIVIVGLRNALFNYAYGELLYLIALENS